MKRCPVCFSVKELRQPNFVCGLDRCPHTWMEFTTQTAKDKEREMNKRFEDKDALHRERMRQWRARLG